MNTYIAKIRWQGRYFQETIQARTAYEAKQILLMKYSGAKIDSVIADR